MQNEIKDSSEKQSIRIKKDIIKHLINVHQNNDIADLYNNICKLEKEKLIMPNDIFQMFSKIFQKCNPLMSIIPKNNE